MTINGLAILTDPTGRFETSLILTRGLNIVTVEARRKHGRPQVLERTVYLEGLDSVHGMISEMPSRAPEST